MSGVFKVTANGRVLAKKPNYSTKSKIEIQMFNQAQQFNSSTSSAFLPILCYTLYYFFVRGQLTNL